MISIAIPQEQRCFTFLFYVAGNSTAAEEKLCLCDGSSALKGQTSLDYGTACKKRIDRPMKSFCVCHVACKTAEFEADAFASWNYIGITKQHSDLDLVEGVEDTSVANPCVLVCHGFKLL